MQLVQAHSRNPRSHASPCCRSCKFGHPLDKAPKVQFNSLGLPLRPGEPECAFYMRNYRWGQGGPLSAPAM